MLSQPYILWRAKAGAWGKKLEGNLREEGSLSSFSISSISMSDVFIISNPWQRSQLSKYSALILQVFPQSPIPKIWKEISGSLGEGVCSSCRHSHCSMFKMQSHFCHLSSSLAPHWNPPNPCCVSACLESQHNAEWHSKNSWLKSSLLFCQPSKHTWLVLYTTK